MLLVFFLLCFVSAGYTALIAPGTPWYDTNGNLIQAHGGGILKSGSTYYWVGEDKAHNSGLFRAVSCYTSSDLASWTRQNDALTPISNTMISTSNIVERPKIIYNQRNNEHVMWFHSDSSNYGAAQVGRATSNSGPCGPYTYQGSWKPFGADSRDMGVYVDDDQAGYLLYASDNNQNFKIARMDDNYNNITSQVATLSGTTLESPGIVKRNGIYYLFASHTSGWDPNPNKWLQSNSLYGGWSSESDLAPRSVRTYFSQNTFDLPLGSNAIYMGDRWRPSQLGSSRYVWLPMTWSSGSPQLIWADVFDVNIQAGTWTIPTGTSYEAEQGSLSGSSRLLNDGSFSGGTAVGYLGSGGSLSMQVQGVGREQWVGLYYANGDSNLRNMTVSVNGGQNVHVDQYPSGGGHVILSIPVKLYLNGGTNTLTFGAGQSNYAADLDKIIVYTV